MKRKTSQQQWSRGNITEGKIPHIRMDHGAAIQVHRKQSETARNV